MKKTKVTRPKGVKEGETVKEWYERITGQGIGSLTGQGTTP